MKNNIYIISTGRSGSTFLSVLFEKNYSSLKLGHQASGSRIINIISNLPFESSIFSGLLEYLLRIFNRADKDNVFSTVDPLLSTAILKIALHKDLNGKYIHLVRSPYDYINSLMKWKKQYRKWILHHLVPFWNPVPFLLSKDFNIFDLIKMKKSIYFAWVWGFKNKSYRKLGDKYPQKYFVLRLEDITNPDVEVRNYTLKQFISFLNVDELEGKSFFKHFSFTDRVNSSKPSNYKHTDYWNETDLSFFDKYCKSEAENYNY